MFSARLELWYWVNIQLSNIDASRLAIWFVLPLDQLVTKDASFVRRFLTFARWVLTLNSLLVEKEGWCHFFIKLISPIIGFIACFVLLPMLQLICEIERISDKNKITFFIAFFRLTAMMILSLHTYRSCYI